MQGRETTILEYSLARLNILKGYGTRFWVFEKARHSGEQVTGDVHKVTVREFWAFKEASSQEGEQRVKCSPSAQHTKAHPW